MSTSLAATTRPPVADLALEGGGVKGIALVGAVEELDRAGYSFARVGGTSAGAVVGAVIAAMQQRNEPLARLADIAASLDYRRFPDRGRIGRLLGPLGFLADGLGVLFEDGAYEGDYLVDWLTGVLGEFDVHTFGDLRLDDPGADTAPKHAWRLVVTASDLSRRRLARFPWDYPDYGLDPDEQPIVAAVRASASIPFFFEPVQLSTSTLVDGGLLSNYPIEIFDRTDGVAPRWPTIGVRLDALRLDHEPDPRPVSGPIHLGIALVETAIEACQAEHVLAPCNLKRSAFVDASDLSAIDFDLSEADEERLLEAGRAAAQKFLAEWDFADWLTTCR